MKIWSTDIWSNGIFFWNFLSKHKKWWLQDVPAHLATAVAEEADQILAE
jgi:hypothetical protein